MRASGSAFRFGQRGGLYAVLALLSVLCMHGTASAAENDVFNPKLSLTGGCTVSSADTEADPGCPEGAHPPKSFSAPTSVTVDSYGDIFVLNFGQQPEGKEGRIDVFNAEGFYIAGSELAVPQGPRSIAVDSDGYLYVYTYKHKVQRYEPAVYEPAVGNIKYKEEPTVIAEGSFAPFAALAVDGEDHLFVHNSNFITEYSSATEGNEVIEEAIADSTLENSQAVGLAIDRTRKRIYASDRIGLSYVIRVFELEGSHALLETINGSTTPAGKFLNNFLSIAVDEGTGNIFVYDGEGAEVVYELTKTGVYISSINYELNKQWVFGATIAVDNGKNSPNGVLNPFGGRFLFVPAFPGGVGHVFAFGPAEIGPPEITASSFTGVTESEAELQAEIKPFGLETGYSFEYTTQESFEEEGFAGAQVAGEGQIPAGLAPVPVSAAAEGLAPGTTYRFRVFAENKEGSDEAEGEFATYSLQALPPCMTDALRTGFSALLPDCRAYELVTPPDTNARSPIGLGHLGSYFASRQASPEGGEVSFQIEGGLIPGSEGTGSLGGDPYLATRGSGGWSTAIAGPNGVESPELVPGSTSPDQGYSFWSTAGGLGSASVEENETHYVRYPDGHSALVGRGSLGIDPRALGGLISEGGGHIIFLTGTLSSAVQLEPDAPPKGTKAIYDRTSDEVTHVASLLPGDVTPAAGENAKYVGASLDGKGIAFLIGNKLYLRCNDEETYEAGENVTFAGVAEGGERIFYLKGGNLFALDISNPEPIAFTETGDVTPVNVSADGTAAYFLSPTALPSGPNPNGDTPQSGKDNIYLSRGGAISFVGIVTDSDVKSKPMGVQQVEGLGSWTEAVGLGTAEIPGRFAIDPSRTTPDGNTLLFESRANLTGYDPEEHVEVYRYDFANKELDCLSCNPTLAPATGEASLQSISPERFKPEPLNAYSAFPNLRADGQRAFFQSTEPLVAGDTDELQDVYEWEAQGVGSCTSPNGCVYLISSGHSDRIDYLYAVSDNGDNAFFRSSDLLLGLDPDATPSIYDARVEGGFVEEEPTVCQGEGCRPSLAPSPVLPTPESGVYGPEGTPPVKRCPKGKHKIVRKGKVRCVKNKKHRQHHHEASSKGKGAAK